MPTLSFSGRTALFDPDTGKIDDDIYYVFTHAPTNELHVHQSGSSDVDFLISVLGKAILKGRIDELPLYNNEDRTHKMVRFKDEQGNLLPEPKLLAEIEKTLTIENMRTYFRFQNQIDNQKQYLPHEDIAEVTATPGTASGIPDNQDALNAYREASGKINPYVKNPYAPYLLASSYAKSMAIENIPYTEYRVSPLGNGVGGNYGNSIESTLSSVYRGFNNAVSYLNQRQISLDYGLIVLFERQNRPGDPDPVKEPAAALKVKQERAIALAHEVIRLKKEGKYNIVGVDLAGDELNNPVTEFEEVFRIFREYNLDPANAERPFGVTIHAAETPKSHSRDGKIKLEGWQSAQKSLEIVYGAPLEEVPENSPLKVRIGHGTQVVNSSKKLKDAFEFSLQHPNDWEKKINVQEVIDSSPLLKFIIKHGVVLEMCPKSNLQTKAVTPDFAKGPNDEGDKPSARGYRRHPAPFLSRLGVKVAISSDNRTISNSDVTNEFVKLYKYGGLTYKDFKRMVMDGFEGSFTSPERKAALIKAAEERFAELEKIPRYIQGLRKMGANLTLRQRFILIRDWLRDRIREWVSVLKRKWSEVCSLPPAIQPAKAS